MSHVPEPHYMRGGIECIDAMRAIATPAEFQAFCRLTAFKYLWRIGEKDNPAREAKKAEDYVRWMKEINGVIVDALTASMLTKVWDVMNETNRAKFGALSLSRMVSIGWSCIK